MKEIKGKKIEMSQVFDEQGRVVPVTSVRVEEWSEKLKPEASVTVVGTSKGKGFAGVMKRWGFHGGPATHGQSDRARAPGPLGEGPTREEFIRERRCREEWATNVLRSRA